MFRLSRLRSPRATFVAFAMLAAAMLGFGTLAELSLAHAPTFVAAEAEDAEGDSEDASRELVVCPDDESWPVRSVPDLNPARPSGGFRPIAAKSPVPKRTQTRA